MHQNRIRNVLLAAVAALLFFSLGVLLSPPVHALGKTQYKAVGVVTEIEHRAGVPGDASHVQRVLDQQSAEGWEYVGSTDMVLIFKK